MKYICELYFKNEPECSSCMLHGTKGFDLNGETVFACYGLGIRPICPEEGCRKDCPLKQMKNQTCGNCKYQHSDIEDEPCRSCKHTAYDSWKKE